LGYKQADSALAIGKKLCGGCKSHSGPCADPVLFHPQGALAATQQQHAKGKAALKEKDAELSALRVHLHEAKLQVLRQGAELEEQERLQAAAARKAASVRVQQVRAICNLVALSAIPWAC
jgi:hypothetical protein